MDYKERMSNTAYERWVIRNHDLLYYIVLDTDGYIKAEYPDDIQKVIRGANWNGALHLFCADLNKINTTGLPFYSKIKLVKISTKVTEGKLMYELIPKGAEEALAEICTFGVVEAGYKPGSWREVDVMLYYAAARRHLEAWRQYMEGDGDLFDNGPKGSGKHHLKHVLTDIAFMLELTETEEKANETRRTD